ncbi:hypothetical protein [Dethiosulfovibrio salsuginis]|uniref:Uncharacterized protein n=1 Tax=Dethiosulfovibrio salsuginis TaxID=561720 RepID=A0A1X7ILF9_9BACT|nr:hypothetical protein [Dethiosulfovibrio salsuginis]SMG15427.1 hypothetical protein SAMN06275492_10338 [Dethiosulfovibrio salsuginis]
MAQSYCTLLNSHEDLSIARELTEQDRRHLEIVQGMYDVGEKPLIDVAQARVNDVLMAPSSALRITMPGQGGNGKSGKRASNGGTVYTLSGDSPVPMKVKIGMAQDGWIEVIGDLQEGVEVVVEVISNGGSSSRGGSPFGPTPGGRR